MKEKFKHWAWRTLLTLTCLIAGFSQANAIKVYLKPNSNWTQANARFAVYCFNSTSNLWVSMTSTSLGDESGYYVSEVDNSTYSTIVFCRMNPDTPENNWGNKWNQSADISMPTTDALYKMSSNTGWDSWTIEPTAVSTMADGYYVVGEPSSVFPTGWSIGDAQQMTANGTTWTWTKSSVNLAADAAIAFKVKKKSGNTETWIPGGDNITVTPQFGAGNYSLTITYVEDAAAPTATLTPLFVTTPVFSPAAGTYSTNQEVTITAGGTIYYTTDGSDPETSETRIAYDGPISVAGEGEHVIKAVSWDGETYSDVATAEYVIKYQNIYLFGSVGKAHAWVYNYNNPELVTSDGVNYSGVVNVNVMNDYHRSDGKVVGLFMLTKGFGTNWETTEPMMIGTTSTTADDHYWIDGGSGHFGEWLNTRPGSENVGNDNLHTNGWSLPTGTYEFFYNSDSKQLMVTAFDGPTIYVYDYTRPYIYVEDKDGKPFDGVQPGNPIQILDETVGGHSGLSTAANGSGDGLGTLGWYKFSVPSNNYPFHFQFHHNGDKKVIDSPFYQDNAGDVYYYWDGAAYQPIEKANTDKLRRIVAHVRVQGTTVPTCDGVEMNGPSSFYGQMYYWMAVTKLNDGANVVITDGKHHYEGTLYSDIYLEWTDATAGDYTVISKETLEQRLASKTGRGTVIHLQKNKNTPTSVTVNDNNYFLGVDTKVEASTGDLDNDNYVNTTNLGATWWGNNNAGFNGSKGTYQQVDGLSETDNMNPNFSNSQYLANDENAPVYTITAENGTEWYTWYSDRSVATIKFGLGTLTGNTQYPTYNPQEHVYSFYANYESEQIYQQAGELWYVWTPDFNAALNGNQSQNNGELIDVTRTYESRAKQKALCSTFRDGNYVYYTDIKGWGDDKVWCYVWTVPGIEWPGIQMVKVGYDDEGHPVYLADLSNYDMTNATGVIFNDGVKNSEATDKRQTGNLDWANQGCYDYLGLIYRIGGNIDVIENEPDGENSSLTLRGVWYSRVKGTLFAKGNNDYNNKSVNSRGYIDFARIVTDDGALQDWEYDQSNWVEIEPSESVSADDLKSLLEMDFTLYGTKLSSVNPRFKAISISDIENGGEYTPNHFTPAHFNGTCFQQRRGDNEWYFFVEPKPNEFALIDWTIYNAGAFHAYTNAGFDGTINVDWSYHDPTYKPEDMTDDLDASQLEDCGKDPHLTDLNGFSDWYAIIKFVEGTSSTKAATGDQFEAEDVSTSTNRAAKYTVYPIKLNDDMATAIETINADKAGGLRTLKATRYYNMMGVESSTPFQGVNIIVKEYTDGSRESSKAIMR